MKVEQQAVCVNEARDVDSLNFKLGDGWLVKTNTPLMGGLVFILERRTNEPSEDDGAERKR
jgi:hypothetical protein